MTVAPYYDHAGITIYHGDCREVMPSPDSVDVVITDPPYGLGFRGNGWDKEVPRVAFDIPGQFKRSAIIMGPVSVWQYPVPKWVACWARPASNSRSNVGGFNHWSPILLYGDVKIRVDYKSWHAIANAYPPGFGHPTPKPERLMRWLVSELSAPGDTVLDPFMGSGTTLVAAKQLGRRAIGIEIEERYCEIAVRRLSGMCIEREAPVPGMPERPATTNLRERSVRAEAEVERLRAVLAAALPYLEVAAEGQPGYGAFHGGNPHDFTPDVECSTEAERAAWTAACDAWDAGQTEPLPDTHERTYDEAGNLVMHRARIGFGLGAYVFRDHDVEAALAAARAALAPAKEPQR